MNLVRHYRTLGLHPSSSARDIKLAYRQLVRYYHPDINPDKQAIERFISINNAYRALSDALYLTAQKSRRRRTQVKSSKAAAVKRQLEKIGIGKSAPSHQPTAPAQTSSAQTAGTDFSPTAVSHREVSPKREASAQAVGSVCDRVQEANLKQEAYLQLTELLKQQKYPRAIALVEGLAHRMPADSEISQWQAIVYQRWGRKLIGQGQLQKARLYLKKALRTDPHNPSLWNEVKRDLWHLSRLSHARKNSSAV